MFRAFYCFAPKADFGAGRLGFFFGRLADRLSRKPNHGSEHYKRDYCCGAASAAHNPRYQIGGLFALRPEHEFVALEACVVIDGQ
jgi:hypothetical protein